MYSLGIILFEMCHPPCSTSMERHKLLAGVRRKEIIFPDSFTSEPGREKQVSSITSVLTTTAALKFAFYTYSLDIP